jgi:hypothetical protein
VTELHAGKAGKMHGKILSWMAVCNASGFHLFPAYGTANQSRPLPRQGLTEQTIHSEPAH